MGTVQRRTTAATAQTDKKILVDGVAVLRAAGMKPCDIRLLLATARRVSGEDLADILA